MKTFLPVISPGLNPWQSMRLSLECLDNQRLGKQRVESFQIYNVITGVSGAKAWRSAPAVHMWRGYPQALGVYIKINCDLWAKRLSKSGQPFSNVKMLEHIQRCGFGKNDAGIDVAALAFEEADAAAVPPAIATVATPRSGTYVDGVRVPWWMHDARVHESDAAILYKKNPQHYKHFAPYSLKYPEYIWPRDIDANHPEQKEELDALAAIMAEEAAKKEAEKAAKEMRKTGRKRARKSKQGKEDEQDEQAEDAEEEEKRSADESAIGRGEDEAMAATPVKRATRRSRSAAAAVKSAPARKVEASSPPVTGMKRRSRSSTRSALEDATAEVLNSADGQPEDEGSTASSSKRRRTAGASPSRSKSAPQDAPASVKRKLVL